MHVHSTFCSYFSKPSCVNFYVNSKTPTWFLYGGCTLVGMTNYTQDDITRILINEFDTRYLYPTQVRKNDNVPHHQTITEVCGSFKNAIQQAGFEYRHENNLTDIIKEQIEKHKDKFKELETGYYTGTEFIQKYRDITNGMRFKTDYIEFINDIVDGVHVTRSKNKKYFIRNDNIHPIDQLEHMLLSEQHRVILEDAYRNGISPKTVLASYDYYVKNTERNKPKNQREIEEKHDISRMSIRKYRTFIKDRIDKDLFIQKGKALPELEPTEIVPEDEREERDS